MSLYYQDDHVTLYHGDSLEVTRGLGHKSVDCIITSPPYYGLRDYGNTGQYGFEASPEDYVETMRALFSELRRTLADDGTAWLNIGDTYKNKRLLGIPWRVALALQSDGWILRNSIIWHKPNAVPESVKDRLSGRHENLFLFSKSMSYWFDLDPIREPHGTPGGMGWAAGGRGQKAQSDQSSAPGRGHDITAKTGIRAMGGHPNGKNPGDVWAINNKPFKGAHFAAFPPSLVQRAMLSGCKPGGTVLDPFSGSGTTGMVARENGRKYVGIDISADYLDLSLTTRLQGEVA